MASAIKLLAENEYLEKQIIRNLKLAARFKGQEDRDFEIVIRKQSIFWVVQVFMTKPYFASVICFVFMDRFSIQALNTGLKSLHEASAKKVDQGLRNDDRE